MEKNILEKVTPESVGIRSKDIAAVMEVFQRKRYAMHSVIIARHGKICFEEYWKPYHAQSLHRLYSSSKSFVSLAIGFLYDEGRLELDDKVITYFPEYEDRTDEYLKQQTIREMLKMSTASVDANWLALGVKKRVEFYFIREQNRPSGTIYTYDSTGTYILSLIVERITGKNFLEYLREKLFDKIGVSDEIDSVKTPEGYLWADSGIRCTARDFYRVAQFACNLGKWGDEQLLSREYMEAATKKQVFTAREGMVLSNGYGYGYQFWITEQEGFAFRGMGSQFAICLPKKDFVFICTADTEFDPSCAEIIFETVFDKLINHISEKGVEEDVQETDRLKALCSNLEIPCAQGEKTTALQRQLFSGIYDLKPNAMNISWFQLQFGEDEGCFIYEKGNKVRKFMFGIGKNVFQEFPEDAMPNENGAECEPGHTHRCGVSGAWVEDQKFYMRIHIVDKKYLGNLHFIIGFKDDCAGIQMISNAEFFLVDYNGFAGGVRRRNEN